MRTIMTRTIFSICLLLVISTALQAQDARDWLLRMNRAFAGSKTCDMSFSMQYYASKRDQRPQLSASGKVAFGQGFYFSSFMGKTVLSNKRCSVVIDDNEKQIVYLPSMEQPKEKPKTPSLEFLLDSALLKTADARMISTTAAFARVRIFPKEGIYESIEVQINALTFAMEELIYIYKPLEEGSPAVKAVIRYDSVRFNTSFDEARFSEKAYLVKHNGKWKGVGSRASYLVIDENSK